MPRQTNREQNSCAFGITGRGLVNRSLGKQLQNVCSKIKHNDSSVFLLFVLEKSWSLYLVNIPGISLPFFCSCSFSVLCSINNLSYFSCKKGRQCIIIWILIKLTPQNIHTGHATADRWCKTRNKINLSKTLELHQLDVSPDTQNIQTKFCYESQ